MQKEMNRLHSLFEEIISSDFYRNILKLFSGIFVARLIPALFAIVIARIYAPESFGVFVLFLSIASLLSIMVTGGYEAALIIAQPGQEKKSIFSLALKINLLSNAFILIIISLYILIFHHPGGDKTTLLLLIPAYAFLFGGVQLIRNLLISNKSFKTLALLEVFRALATGIFQLALFKFHGTGLFIGVCLAQAITFGWFLSKIPEISGFRFSSFTTSEKQAAYRFRNFPLFSVPSEMLNYLSNQLPVFLIKPFFGSVRLGLYSFSHRYLSIPVQLTSISIGSVYIQQARSLLPYPEKLSSLTFGLLKKQVWLSVIPFTLLTLWGKEIFGFVFGNEWEFSGTLAQLISPWLFAVFVSSPLSSIFVVREKQKLSLIFNILLLAARALSLGLGGWLLKDITITIGLYSLTGFIFFILLGIYSLYLAHVNLWEVLFLFVKVFLICVVPFILIYLWI
jgi:O-antigen/teichoic acid export membrane protein